MLGKFFPKYIFFTLAIIVLLGCNDTSKKEKVGISKVIKIGVLPDQSPQAVKEKYEIVVNYLEQETGRNFELVIPDTYEHSLKMFVEGAVDVAYFGGVTFLEAYKKVNAVPLVSREVDSKFTSLVIANPKVNAKTLEELKGSNFSFGSKLSTSGHFMPRYFLMKKGIKPEEFFSEVSYSGAHDKTALLVQSGQVDAGAVNSVIITKMLDDNRLNKEDLQILWRTPTYQDYVWVIQANTQESVRQDILDAFLKLSEFNPEHKFVLSSLNAKHFIPVGIDDYKMLLAVIDQLGMSSR